MRIAVWKSSLQVLFTLGRHPGIVELVGDIHGELPPLRGRVVALHLSHCPACRELRGMVSDTFLRLDAIHHVAATAEEERLLELGRQNLINEMAGLLEQNSVGAVAEPAPISAGAITKVVELLRPYLGEPAAGKVLLGGADSVRFRQLLDDSIQMVSAFLGREMGENVRERISELLKEGGTGGFAPQSATHRL